MKFLSAIPLIAATLTSLAQCPIDENDLADGGTFSGTCALAVGLNVTITATVNWTSGTLTITGGSGRIRVDNGAVLNVQGGAIITTDDGDSNGNTDGPIDVLPGGTINVFAGASITCAERITVDDGTFNIYGTVQSLRSSFDISSGGTIFVDATGNLSLGGSGDATIVGALNVEGNLTMLGDVEINGGSVIISDNANVNLDNDLFVYGGGSLQIIDNAYVEIAGNLANSDDSPDFRTPAGPGSIIIGGTLVVGDNLYIDDTTPDSELLGQVGGELSVFGGYFIDAECQTYTQDELTFCDCSGNGAACSASLPIELIDFSAEQMGNSVLLKWITASELNNESYTLERFTDLDDINVLVKMPGKGTTNEISEYSFIDRNPFIGNNYYQLKQTDFNGNSTYSKTLKLNVNQVRQQLSIFTNINQETFISLRASGFIPFAILPVSVLGVNGDIILSTYETTNESGVILKEIDTTTLNPGLYIIKVASLHTKFIK